MGTHFSIHLVALQHKHGAHLAVNGGDHDAGGPYGENSDYGLEFLNLGYSAKPPWIGIAFYIVHFSHYCSLVKEPVSAIILERLIT